MYYNQISLQCTMHYVRTIKIIISICSSIAFYKISERNFTSKRIDIKYSLLFIYSWSEHNKIVKIVTTLTSKPSKTQTFKTLIKVQRITNYILECISRYNKYCWFLVKNAVSRNQVVSQVIYIFLNNLVRAKSGAKFRYCRTSIIDFMQGEGAFLPHFDPWAAPRKTILSRVKKTDILRL